mgnify:CR=1 FL=1
MKAFWKNNPALRIALMIVLFLAFSACLDIAHKLLPSVNSHLTPDFFHLQRG